LAVAAERFALLGVGALVISETVHWRASKWYLPETAPSGPAALIVLGFPTKSNGAVHPVQKWRVQVARRAYEQLGAQKVVFSGGPSKGRAAEADTMAAYAVSLGIPERVIETETHATSTWENVKFCLPLVSDFARLALVSDPLHAARARRYVRAQRPELGARLVSAGEYRPFEYRWWKIAFAAYEIHSAMPGSRRGRARDTKVARGLAR
jgi:uncharacterized SAM-binding protein YcdF (DUF218 family)